MIMDWKNQHSKNGYTTKNNLHVQFNSHQNLNDTHHRDLKIYPKIHLETKKTVNSQDNTEQKKQCWEYHNSNKNSRVLTQKHT
jgi:hypothetical protein